MENDDTNVDPVTAAFGVAAAVAVIFNTILTIAKELNPALLAWMKSVSWHHWTTHGFLVLGVFFIAGWLLSRKHMQIRGTLLAEILVGSVILGGLGIFVLYLYLYFY
ncbi:MAG: hypothetical protein A2942_02520 [Candidatus Lloydbacteria bacterium RIFCSPLOWO2_01_FULL_50_20]|uniref:Uncharacterized protein n=1 Tax=Candidatus Lloydbacteria bacterium RIFCSPLOWO2_01_FULL_50_20 TaxID=1798665 RepID=A0A1G2DFB6_9BACT|nr:MAG: hypothetical protein A3C13_01865 [Candidatus Lloydbacteria bacterium RIFCSPHIGHO2_02_FULL_50_11]OGZ12122.1 MAG: hypothetical protein A2942_02520 [Candidatus Lloydbacteria bacterium RIFCSPLOWO2_01_FULL_50_20]